MCQLPDAGDVADRPQALAHAQVCVDRDAVSVGFHADGLEADITDARPPAGGDQQAVAAELAAVAEFEHVVVAVAARGARAHTENEVDTVPLQDLAERLAERGRLMREQVLGRFDQRHLAAEPANGLRHFDADRPAAEHEQLPRHGLHAGHLAVRPDAVELAQAGNGREHRVGSGGEDDVLGRVTDAVDLDHADSRQPAAAPQQLDTVVCEEAHLAGVGVVRDHEVAPRERRLDVHLRARRRVTGGVHRFARTQQRL